VDIYDVTRSCYD